MKRSWNLILWFGFVLALAGFLSYPMFFARYPITRDVPWASLSIMALGLTLIGVGAARAFTKPEQYRGKISGSILAVLALAVAGAFCYGVFVSTKQLPASHGAPHAGQPASDFTLPDSKGTPVTLSAVIDSPFTPNRPGAAAASTAKTAATLLIFYRGYW
ncbi:MAG: hypothetical protein KGL02_13685 [Acidobacteriota bacterium]|nr:hypothetical protein [Acidobacteriota bacterium]